MQERVRLILVKLNAHAMTGMLLQFVHRKHVMAIKVVIMVLLIIIGTCTLKPGENWKCQCNKGWIGPNCNKEDCDQNYCKNGGKILQQKVIVVRIHNMREFVHAQLIMMVNNVKIKYVKKILVIVMVLIILYFR